MRAFDPSLTEQEIRRDYQQRTDGRSEPSFDPAIFPPLVEDAKAIGQQFRRTGPSCRVVEWRRSGTERTSFTVNNPRNWRAWCGNSWPLDDDRAGRWLLRPGSEQDHGGDDRHDPDRGHRDDERAKRIAGGMRLPVECEKDHDRPIKQKRKANQ